MPKTEEESWTFCLVSIDHQFSIKYTRIKIHIFIVLSGVYSSLLGEYARPSLDLSCRACTRMVTRLYFAGFFDAVPTELLTFCQILY